MKTTLFIPVLNEIDGLKIILPRIHKEWVDEILFVDGGSTDGSKEYLEKQGYRVIRQRGKGLEDAYWECFAAASGDVIIPFSPDNNSIPELIPKMIQKMHEGYDLVIASRYLDGAKSEDDDLITAFGNWFFTRLFNFLFGGHCTDVNVMYRAFKKELIETLAIEKKNFPVLEQQLMIRSLKHGLKIAEIPGDDLKPSLLKRSNLSSNHHPFHSREVVEEVLLQFAHHMGQGLVTRNNLEWRYPLHSLPT